MEKTIIIKPVVKAKFSGISKHSGTTTVITGAQLSKKTGLYKTGLTIEEEAEYETKLSLTKGTLGKRSSYWGDMSIRLFNDKATYITIVSPYDELLEKIIYEHSIVANNELELSKNSMCEFYIEDPEAKAKVEEIGIDLEVEANEILSDTTTDEKRGYLKLYPGTKGVDTFSERMVKTELYKKMKADPKKFIDFSKDPDLKVRILIEELLDAGKLVKKGSFYNYEGEVIGNSVEAAISFFKDLRNQSTKLVAEQSIKNTKKGKE